MPISKSMVNNGKVTLQSINRYNFEMMSQDKIDYDQSENLYRLDESIAPKKNSFKLSKVSEPTAATSSVNQHYLTFDADNLQSPKQGHAFQISNQNALLSLMSHDDLEGIKQQIHSKINKIAEVEDEEEHRFAASKENHDECSQVVQRLRGRR